MCGITGFNWEDKDLIKRMSSIISHRGPDGEGHYTNKSISLGHRRLSIIDLSQNGKQPMCNEDETIHITFNGEIYNFLELRRILENKGHRFHSNTDTEVLVHGYEEWGESIVEKLNGMFAFAIWDGNTKKLFLARDRLGIKPLYYYWKNKKLIFSSEIKSILLAPGIERKIDNNAAYNYLNLRYIPGENTMFTDIKKLLPGHTLTLQKKSISIKQFWNIPLPKQEYDTKAAKKVKLQFKESVRKRLIADVPVGVYLSGGIDSASIVAATSYLKKEPVKTFSVGFDYDSKVDELHKARFIAQHFQTDHKEIIVNESIKNLLPKILWHLDMPHGDPVIIPMFKLSEEAKKKVTVVLSGEGADEVFGGYVQYKTFLQAKKVRYLPKTITTHIAKKMPIKMLDNFFDYPSSIGEKGKEKLLDFISHLRDEDVAYQDLISILSDKDRKRLLKSKQKEREQLHLRRFTRQRKPLLNRMLYYDTKTWLPNYVLFVNDRMTMANSIEGRVPFLDHTFVEYGNTLHPKLKINGSTNKFVFRQAMRKILPKQVSSTKKHAFFMPLDKWYKEELKDLAEQLFTPSKVRERGFFEYNHLKKIWENYNRSKLLYGKQLFTTINFELWCRMFIDSEKIPISNKIKLDSLL